MTLRNTSRQVLVESFIGVQIWTCYENISTIQILRLSVSFPVILEVGLTKHCWSLLFLPSFFRDNQNAMEEIGTDMDGLGHGENSEN